MGTIRLHNQKEIEEFLRHNTFHHIYSIGDLDDCHWPHTEWYGEKSNGEIKAIVLVYKGLKLPVVLAIAPENSEAMEKLLAEIFPKLPNKFYAHLSPGLEKMLDDGYSREAHGQHYKMGLMDKDKLNAVDTSEVIPLGVEYIDDMLRLYTESYPGHWFDPRMVETGFYFGIRRDDRVVSVAGVHVYSAIYKVTALGNITTHPDYRGNGLAKACVAHLCKNLLESVYAIGLNVQSDNDRALSAYRHLGFETVATYEEYMVERK